MRSETIVPDKIRKKAITEEITRPTGPDSKKAIGRASTPAPMVVEMARAIAPNTVSFRNHRIYALLEGRYFKLQSEKFMCLEEQKSRMQSITTAYR